MDKKQCCSEPEETELRKGPWIMEEDLILVNYIANHGEGAWNNLAKAAGLKRTGKSCRLRWLNYLRPTVKRGNITHEEQLLIMDLHSKWGNRWSRIAKHLPGRTDNEIKNFWRTRIQKHVKESRDCSEQSSVANYQRSTSQLPSQADNMFTFSPPSYDDFSYTYSETFFVDPDESSFCMDDFWIM